MENKGITKTLLVVIAVLALALSCGTGFWCGAVMNQIGQPQVTYR